MSDLVKQSWLERAKETHKFHIIKRKEHPRWRVQDTAKSLKRSLGSISEDLLIATWCKTNENQLKRFDYAYEAIRFIRAKEDELFLDDKGS